MVHQSNRLVRRKSWSHIGEKPNMHLPYNINTLTALRCAGYVPMWEFFIYKKKKRPLNLSLIDFLILNDFVIANIDSIYLLM